MFLGRVFEITPDVLVPRWYTETLVKLVIDHVRRSEVSFPRVLDMGTGTGCIAISLAKELEEQCSFVAADISPEALSVARRNALALQASVSFINSDLFNHVSGRFDIVVANLPYVPLRDYKSLFHTLQHEPRVALCDGTNRWQIFQQFFAQAPNHLMKGARIFLEIDPNSRPFLSKWAERYLNPKEIVFHSDEENNERFLQIVLP
jgi:release factor glutamine methyltransferase